MLGATARRKTQRRKRRWSAEWLEPRLPLSADPIITEFMADNGRTLRDGSTPPAYEDWIEIYNAGDEAIDLAGWHLTDDPDRPDHWTFPSTVLAPGAYLVVFASGAGVPDAAGNLHADFRLGSDGDYLALVRPDDGVASEFGLGGQNFPPQFPDVAYGLGVEETTIPLVAADAAARFRVPASAADVSADWTQSWFDDAAWSDAAGGVGYNRELPPPSFAGFLTRMISIGSASGPIENVTTAEDIASRADGAIGFHGAYEFLADVSHNVAVVDYAGGAGTFGVNNPYPNGVGGTGNEQFVLHATSEVTIPVGTWQIAFGSDDGGRLILAGVDFTSTFGIDAEDPPPDQIRYESPRGHAWTGGTLTVVGAPLVTTLDVLAFDRTGTDSLEVAIRNASTGESATVAAANGWALLGEGQFGWSLAAELPGAGPTSASSRQEIHAYDDLIATDVESALFGQNGSSFVRYAFSVSDRTAFEALRLRMRYDDGFVAYLNGVEVARSGAANPVTWNSTSSVPRTKGETISPLDITLSFPVGSLNAGPASRNVLAIQGLNADPSDDDFLLQPELVGVHIVTQADRYFARPTPGAANDSASFVGVVSELGVSHERGMYGAAFDLTLATTTVGATIRYTTDGSQPSEANGAVYAGPVRIDRTTTVRAVADRPGFLSSRIQTHTYLFLNDVARQSYQAALDAGLPAAWGGTAPDYGVDSDVVGPGDLFAGLYANQFTAALAAIPTLSIVLDVDDVFGPSGIYSNPNSTGTAWERPTSVELIYADGSQGIQADAGIRIQGGAFRSHSLTKKKSFRLAFRQDYGPTKLKFPIFDDGTFESGAANGSGAPSGSADGFEAVEEFDTITLRANNNDGWQWSSAGGKPQYIRDEWGRATQLVMGQAAPHGTFMHVYVNGQYWGLYNPVERPDASFSASYYGGDKDEWDGINAGTAINGTLTAWNALLTGADAVNVTDPVASNAAYQRLLGHFPNGADDPAVETLLDAENLIDYMLVNIYGGNNDWPGKNYYVGRRRGPESTGFKFYSWDAEWSLNLQSSVTTDRTSVNTGVAQPYDRLKRNAQFRLLFADRVHRHFFNGGALYVDPVDRAWDPAHPERNVPAARYKTLADQIEAAIVGESARWGDQHRAAPYTQADWIAERNAMLASYFPQRSANVLGYLKAAGLYSATDAPVYSIGGQYQHGCTVAYGAVLTMANPNVISNPAIPGTIYYTLDGSDPRAYDWGTNTDSVAPTAVAYSAANPIVLTRATTVKSRVRRDLGGGQYQWSALDEADYAVRLTDLRITEVHYNPASPTPTELAQGFVDAGDFEFIELANLGPTTLSLADARLTDGVAFDFSDGVVGTLAPGQHVVVVGNQPAFIERYGSGIAVVGQYVGRLDNGGERVALSDVLGGTLVEFSYSDNWYPHTDGGGYALAVLDPADADADLDQKSSWRPSRSVAGSPGESESAIAPGSVIVNEVLAHPAAPSGVSTGTWIELRNTTATPIDVGSWYVSNTADERRKYQIAAGAVISAGGYLVLTETDDFGSAGGDPGATIPFTLSPHGDSVLLTEGDSAGNLLGNWESQSFAASESGVSLAVYAKSTGGADFVRVTTPTPAADNAPPIVGPLVISEIMYHPPTTGGTSGTGGTGTGAAGIANAEYIEIHNLSSLPVPLDDGAGHAWRLREAIDYSFPLGQSIPAGGYALVVQGSDGGDAAAESAAFRAARNVPGDVPIFIYTDLLHRSLNNDGEKVHLDRPGDPNSGQSPQPYVLVDAVRYDDVAPWPTVADGGGSALSRLTPGDYGNDVANWVASTRDGTPGRPNIGIDATPPSVPGGTRGRIVSASRVQLAWDPSADLQSGVDHYNVYRNGGLAGAARLPVLTDAVVFGAAPFSYEFTAVNNDGFESPRSMPIVIGPASIAFQSGSLPSPAYDGAADAIIRQGQPNDNHGGDANLEVDGDDAGFDLASLVKWTLSGIPPGSTVVAASIAINVSNATAGPYQVSQLLRDWREDQVTWNQYAAGQTWQTPGALGATDRGPVLATINAAAVGAYAVNFSPAGVAAVQSWADETTPNFGAIVANASSTDGLDFNSREVTTPATHPRLNVSYLPPLDPGLPGDVQQDGAVDAADIDLLYQAIAAGTLDPLFDLNGDAAVDRADVDRLVGDILGTLYGDVNLDHRVNRIDAALLLANLGRADRPSWRHGDVDGDGRMGIADLALVGVNLGFVAPSPVAASAIAPSPAAVVAPSVLARSPDRATGLVSTRGASTGEIRRGVSQTAIATCSAAAACPTQRSLTLRALRSPPRKLSSSAVDVALEDAAREEGDRPASNGHLTTTTGPHTMRSLSI